MSIEAVNQFLTKVNQDEKLQAELSQVMKSQNDRQAAVDLAAKHGYEFTTEELNERIEQIQSIQAKQAANETLSEEELEAVSGGGIPSGRMKNGWFGVPYPPEYKSKF